MNKHSGATLLPCIIRVFVVIILSSCISSSLTSDLVYAQPQFTHDLLILSTPPLHYPTRIEDSFLFLLDGVTGEITQLETTDLPAGGDALSPNGQYFAVYRGNQLCLVNSHWETHYCLPEDLAGNTNEVTVEFSPQDIYWESNSLSFWVTSGEESELYPSILQIRSEDGEILSEYPIGEGDYTEQVFVSDFSPMNHTITIQHPYLRTVYELEDFEPLYQALYDGYSLSPDGMYLAERRTYHDYPYLFAIIDLAKEPQIHYTLQDPDRLTLIGPDNAWSDTPGIVWQEYTTFAVSWSHDGEMIAFRRNVSNDVTPSGAGTFVYFFDTQEVRFIAAREDGMFGTLIWSPDDTAIAQITNWPEGANFLSIVTLNGEIIPVDVSAFFAESSIEAYPRTLNATWIPHGWLQLD
jgi:hypothetical protein